VPASHTERDWTQPYAGKRRGRSRLAAGLPRARHHWDLYQLGEELTDLEDAFRLWRFRHVTTVERIIGFKRGTGGTSGVGYLRKMLDVVLFPEIWRCAPMQYLLHTPGVQPFDFGQAQAYARRFPGLQPLLLPRGVVDLANDQPRRDLHLVGATASLVARADLHPALVQLLLQTAHQVHGGAGWFHRGGQFPNADTDHWPLAPEAERYHRSGPPWLQRALPFWLANFVDRMWIVLLPLLAALVPLSRVVPPLVTLRLRSRVYRWYAHLRAVEQALESPHADLAQLAQELERIDAQTERIGLPLSFTNELYDLRAHIELVRKRLRARAPAAA
jgi:hypothetical protein